MKRPRGFIDYKPRAAKLELIGEVTRVLLEYEDVLPLTLRQIFYILVTRSVLGKTEQEYSRLTETMNKARRGGLIEWEAIRDDGFTLKGSHGFEDLDELFRWFKQQARSFILDRQQGQERRLQLWCEAAGMVPQLERIATDYGIPVASSGGFDSTTTKHTVGRDFADEDTLVLHIGDHDPSGVHMFSSLAEDIEAFADSYGGSVEFVRLAVTPEQMESYNLPTAPPKVTDNRSFSGPTTQAEALDPRTLAAIVRDSIESHMDMEIYTEVLGEERELKQIAISRVSTLIP